MNLEYRINESYDRLTANDREVLNRILRNKAQSAGMNSTELAAFCHVSRTTLIRLFKKLGIGGFAEFRLLLKRTGRDAGAGPPGYGGNHIQLPPHGGRS